MSQIWELIGSAGLVEDSHWQKRVAIVLACYLDDSGADEQSPAVILAGYLGTVNNIRKYETEALKVYRRHRVKVLHTKKLFHRQGEFKGWTRDQQRAFVDDLYIVAKKRFMIGVSSATNKDAYDRRCRELGLNQNESAYGYSLRTLLDDLFELPDIFQKILEHKISLVIEAGNVNDNDIRRVFNVLREDEQLREVLKSLSFVPKENSRAVQLADYVAFHSRRYLASGCQDRGEITKLENYMRHIGRVAEDFGLDQ